MFSWLVVSQSRSEQDRQLDSDYQSDNDLKESTKSEIDLIINAQRFMEYQQPTN